MAKKKFKIRVKQFLPAFPADQLRPSPFNWRGHPAFQERALTAVLEKVGFVGAVLARPHAEGGYEVIDGHLRQKVTKGQDVPVLVVDLSDEEARIILATFDPLTAHAETEPEALKRLLAEVPDFDADVSHMLADVEAEASVYMGSPPEVANYFDFSNVQKLKGKQDESEERGQQGAAEGTDVQQDGAQEQGGDGDVVPAQPGGEDGPPQEQGRKDVPGLTFPLTCPHCRKEIYEL